MGLTTCGYMSKERALLHNRAKEYRQHTQSVPALKIPPGMSADKLKNSYPIPDVNEQGMNRQISLIPPGSHIGSQ